ncbi:MAG: histidine kinase [Ilumatobacteraceae bacterium]
MDLGRPSQSLGALLRLALGAVTVAAYAVDVWLVDGSGGGTRVPLVPVAGVAAAGLAWLAWRRATPVLALAVASASLLVTASVDGFSRFAFFTEFVVLPLLFGAVLATATRWRWTVAALLFGAAEAVALRSGDAPIRWIIAISMLVLLGLAATAVMYIRLRDGERRSSIEAARQNERLAVARELHDVVGHHVTGIVVLAQARRFAGTAARGHEQIDATLAEIERAGLETLTSVRRLVGLLRAEPTTAVGPQFTDIAALVDDLRRSHPLTTLDADDAIRAGWVPADLAMTVQRVVQEATMNVRRHGDPLEPAIVRLGRSDAAIVLHVENGLAGRPAPAGYGLVGMRERVEAFGGTFAAGPTGTRWSVDVTLPAVGIDTP